ncbi:nuclear transport factor 2 family protein [Frankia sp. AgB1.9]|uniref:nuclear transport factor 2 family protein n=1 Tax=unclassified Frankia TaxID=2632575 RepID=UPI00193403A8|nr:MULTISPECIES: nuclear transport factor 2 family protein [unclassified Frankia]MBL7551488.1 nuclear transport factor 2 family protein [Frankia sp. AgB1.9]MBL7617762.1 nuclear transport factor 2 family protein [Frankia sp. AgB1.8]
MAVDLPQDDVLAIQEILALFSYVFDDNDVDGLGLVFTPDATVEHGIGPHRSYHGLAELADYVLSKSAAAPDHFTVNTALSARDDGTVLARSRYIGINRDSRLTSGEFLDIFVRTAQGWRISYRRGIPRTPRAEGAGVPTSAALDPWRVTLAGRA